MTIAECAALPPQLAARLSWSGPIAAPIIVRALRAFPLSQQRHVHWQRRYATLGRGKDLWEQVGTSVDQRMPGRSAMISMMPRKHRVTWSSGKLLVQRIRAWLLQARSPAQPNGAWFS